MNQDNGILGRNVVLVENPECPVCHSGSVLRIEEGGFRKWKNGMPIQLALPKLTNDEREMLTTGIHPFCFDKVHGV